MRIMLRKMNLEIVKHDTSLRIKDSVNEETCKTRECLRQRAMKVASYPNVGERVGYLIHHKSFGADNFINI
jgi:hypothetical protein